jgi:hypothetical protein
MKHLKSYLILIVFSISSLFFKKITTAEVRTTKNLLQQVTHNKRWGIAHGKTDADAVLDVCAM